jgi:hypothetical protein
LLGRGYLNAGKAKPAEGYPEHLTERWALEVLL